jgi:hypothetical protein
MRSVSWIVFSVLVVACSAKSNNMLAPPVSDDASTDTVTGGSDATPTPDTATPPSDRVTPPADRVTPPADVAGGGFGECGMAAVRTLCGCGMDAACQGRAIQSSGACTMCFGRAIGSCCPAQAATLQMCGQTAMCTDDACLQSMCRMQYTALQTCFTTAQQNDTACQNVLAGCFGAFPPACM